MSSLRVIVNFFESLFVGMVSFGIVLCPRARRQITSLGYSQSAGIFHFSRAMQSEIERRAFTRFPSRPHAAAIALNDPLANCQAQAGAGIFILVQSLK